jgi:hypothetical protein
MSYSKRMGLNLMNFKDFAAIVVYCFGGDFVGSLGNLPSVPASSPRARLSSQVRARSSLRKYKFHRREKSEVRQGGHLELAAILAHQNHPRERV